MERLINVSSRESMLFSSLPSRSFSPLNRSIHRKKETLGIHSRGESLVLMSIISAISWNESQTSSRTFSAASGPFLRSLPRETSSLIFPTVLSKGRIGSSTFEHNMLRPVIIRFRICFSLFFQPYSVTRYIIRLSRSSPPPSLSFPFELEPKEELLEFGRGWRESTEMQITKEKGKEIRLFDEYYFRWRNFSIWYKKEEILAVNERVRANKESGVVTCKLLGSLLRSFRAKKPYFGFLYLPHSWVINRTGIEFTSKTWGWKKN